MSETNWRRRKYRTTNWQAYSTVLKSRSNLTIRQREEFQTNPSPKMAAPDV